MKKALKALDNPDQSLSEVEQVNHTRLCLLQIGEQINTCLAGITEPEKIKEWRRWLQTLFSRLIVHLFIHLFLVTCGILSRNSRNLMPKNCTSCINALAKRTRSQIRKKYIIRVWVFFLDFHVLILVAVITQQFQC